MSKARVCLRLSWQMMWHDGLHTLLDLLETWHTHGDYCRPTEYQFIWNLNQGFLKNQLFSNCMEWNDYFNVSIKKVSVFEMPAIIRCMKLIMESIKPNVKTLVPCVLFNVGCLAEHDWKASAQTEFSSSWLVPTNSILF